MDPWLNEYDRLTQFASGISADIKEVHTLARSAASSTNLAKQSATVRRRLVQLTTDIANLHDSLPKLQITEKERQRRKDMIFNLSTRKDQLSDSMSQPADSVGRESLLGAPPEKGIGKRAWGKDARPQETEATKDLDNSQLVSYQKDQMTQQDEHLDLLSNSIVKQKEVAVTINTELNYHEKLLDNLDVKIHKTQHGIEKETEHIDKVSEASKVCGMWVCIVLLIIFLIVFAATGWGCKIYYDKDRCS